VRKNIGEKRIDRGTGLLERKQKGIHILITKRANPEMDYIRANTFKPVATCGSRSTQLSI
jgi:hypothetical protein